MYLTKPQELIWDMERFAGDSVAVICASVLRNGHRDERNLQHAVNRLFCLNDALRIRIKVQGDNVVQEIAEYKEQQAEVLYFPDAPALEKYAESFAKTPMNIYGPLCEVKILILPEQYGLLVKIHHLIADAWTMALLAKQFNMLMDGKEPQAYGYHEYCEKEMAYRSSNRYVQDKQFFTNQIKQCSDPVFIREQNISTTAAARKALVIHPEEMEKIREFAQQHNFSVYSLFATVLAVYLSRINANAEKIYIGTTVLNRMNAREKDTAGMFVNTVPLLLTVRPELGFLEHLEETKERLMAVFRHQRYNYAELLHDVQKEGVPQGRLFDVLLNYINAVVDGADQKVESSWYHNGTQNESLQIHLDDREGEGILRVTYDYHVEKFSEADISRLHFHLMNLLFDGINYSGKAACKLNMLSPEEEQKLRFDFNDTAWTYPIHQGSTIFSLFEEKARKNPEKVCISIGDRQLRYGELLRYAETLDGEIHKISDGKKTVVAVIAERSLEMYCAIYGIIRGGSAYLPIPPDHPQDRIDYILENSGASAAVVQEQFAPLAGKIPCINMTQMLMNAPVQENPIPGRASEEDVAYVIYTSGSTGMPKGARVSHKSVLNRILWMNDAYPLGVGGKILQKTPFSFDVSVWEIFWWGMCGGSMAASKPGEHILPAKLLEEIERHQITHLHFVPSVFDLFVKYLENNSDERQRFRWVKHVFLSGEALEHTLVRRFYALYDYKSVRLHNLYGPTECAVDVTYYDCLPEDDLIPIGMPIYNTQIYITDSYLNLLPTGVVGELLIGGQNVGLGYINAPDLTRKSFVDDPFGGETLYKTGDMAYRRDDGQIIFCGRKDAQIKLNGQRIEVDEIEATIKSVPGVDNVAVIMRTIHDNQALTAFYCGAADVEGTILRLCEKKLPRYMVPTRFVWMEQLPLNPNGKMDRKALGNIHLEWRPADTVQPPVDAVEKEICARYCSVLGLKSVGRNSDFFALGGTSLSVISFLTEGSYEHITPAQFIQNATPAKFAALIRSYQLHRKQYLQPLYEVPEGKKACVFFPYAGGNAEAYINLSKAINRLNREVSLYFVPYLHSDAECEAAAEELIMHLSGQEVCFYAHCAGSALALRILQIIEEKQQDFVKHCFIAGSVPFRRVFSRTIWDFVPDSVIKGILKLVGAPFDMLSASKTAEIIGHFRKDIDFAAQVFVMYIRQSGARFP